MQSIQRVVQRIADIEKHIANMSQTPTGGFRSVLQTAEQQLESKSGDAGIEGLVKTAAQKYGVDSKLAIAVAVAESGLQPQAVSSAGAVGVMQLMPETAQGLGVSNIYDPRENIDGGVRYLKELLNTFNGDVSKAVAAYNAGPAAVKRYGGVPPYAETREYVSKVLSLSS